MLICEKEGFDELLAAERIPERYDLALMSTKGISAIAARHLARDLDVPCFTLRDLDKNGFVMAAGFPFATPIGIHIVDVNEWGLAPEDQVHKNPDKARRNLRKNGATDEEAEFVSGGQRVELNMFTGEQLIEFVTGKLDEHGVEKIVPDEQTLAAAWTRAHRGLRVNEIIEAVNDGERIEPTDGDFPPLPDDLAEQIRERFVTDPAQPWDDALWEIAEGASR